MACIVFVDLARLKREGKEQALLEKIEEQRRSQDPDVVSGIERVEVDIGRESGTVYIWAAKDMFAVETGEDWMDAILEALGLTEDDCEANFA